MSLKYEPSSEPVHISAKWLLDVKGECAAMKALLKAGAKVDAKY